MSGGGWGWGQALVGKWGRVPDGGIDQIFANPVPTQGKNPVLCPKLLGFRNRSAYKMPLSHWLTAVSGENQLSIPQSNNDDDDDDDDDDNIL